MQRSGDGRHTTTRKHRRGTQNNSTCKERHCNAQRRHCNAQRRQAHHDTRGARQQRAGPQSANAATTAHTCSCPSCASASASFAPASAKKSCSVAAGGSITARRPAFRCKREQPRRSLSARQDCACVGAQNKHAEGRQSAGQMNQHTEPVSQREDLRQRAAQQRRQLGPQQVTAGTEGGGADSTIAEDGEQGRRAQSAQPRIRQAQQLNGNRRKLRTATLRAAKRTGAFAGGGVVHENVDALGARRLTRRALCRRNREARSATTNLISKSQGVHSRATEGGRGWGRPHSIASSSAAQNGPKRPCRRARE